MNEMLLQLQIFFKFSLSCQNQGGLLETAWRADPKNLQRIMLLVSNRQFACSELLKIYKLEVYELVQSSQGWSPPLC